MITKIAGKLRLALAGLCIVCAAPMAAADERPLPFDFSGAYAGFSRTDGLGDSTWSDQTLPLNTGGFDLSGNGGGAILGYNWRTGRSYFGVALDFTVNPLTGTGTASCTAGCETSLQNYVALRAQLGHRMGDGHLYGFAGLAIGRVDLMPIGLPTQERDSRGWLAGIGYEHPWDNGWAFRVELQYMDFEDTRYTLSGPVHGVSDNRVGMLRIGLTRYF
ncbi:outer membrane protein [Nioella aestuarii]|uniref:outer membrane protein n=1 Tax=Nioella aestuarii TaxID=1662864 RepID=UPI003D7F3819